MTSAFGIDHGGVSKAAPGTAAFSGKAQKAYNTFNRGDGSLKPVATAGLFAAGAGGGMAWNKHKRGDALKGRYSLKRNPDKVSKAFSFKPPKMQLPSQMKPANGVSGGARRGPAGPGTGLAGQRRGQGRLRQMATGPAGQAAGLGAAGAAGGVGLHGLMQRRKQQP